MKMNEPRESFDCIAFKDRVQEEIYEEIKDMSHEEQIEYFRRHAQKGPFAAWWKQAQQKSRSAGAPRK